MPRAGGSYVYASRGAQSLPRLRRLVLAVVLALRGDRRGLLPHRAVPARHRRGAAGGRAVAATLETGPIRLAISLAVSLGAPWSSTCAACKVYERLIVPLMFLTFLLGGVVIVAGFSLRPRRLRRGAAGARGSRRRRRRRAAARVVRAAAGVGAPVRLVHRLRFDRAGRRRGAGARAATCRSRSASASASVGVFYMLFTARGVPRRAVAVHRRRGAAPRPDGARVCSGICCRRRGRC